MSGSDLRIIDRKFILGLAQNTGSSGSNVANALRGGSSSTVELSSQGGVRVFTNAVQRLNFVGGGLNIARSALLELGEVTTEMIEIAERAAKQTIGSSTRDRLSVLFNKKIDEFRDVVEATDFFGKNLLNFDDDGLKDVFQFLGLNEDQSRELRDIFANFMVGERDDSLASERITADRVKVPNFAFNSTGNDPTDYQVKQMTQTSGITNGFVTSQGQVYTAATEDFLNQSETGATTAVAELNNGNVRELPPNFLTNGEDVVVHAVNELNGDFLFESTEDWVGYNPLNAENLFLADKEGNILGQVTDNPNPGIFTFDSADINGDSSRVIVSYNWPAGNAEYVDIIDTDNVGVDPGTLPQANLFTADTTAGQSADAVKISNFDNYYAFRANDGTNERLVYVDESLTVSAGLYADTSVGDDFGFAQDDRLIVLKNGSYTGSVYTGDIAYYDFNAVVYQDLETSVDVERGLLEVTQLDSITGGNPVLAYVDSNGSGGELNVYEITDAGKGDVIYGSGGAESFTLGASDSVNSLSLAYNNFGTVDIGVDGVLASINGDTDQEFYKFSLKQRENQNRFAVSNVSQDGPFRRDIRSLIDSVFTLADLKELKNQIEDNVEALEEAQEYLLNVANLARNTGLAFLEVQETAAGDEEPEEIALRIRKLIRASSDPRVLSVAHALDPLASAALLAFDPGDPFAGISASGSSSTSSSASSSEGEGEEES